MKTSGAKGPKDLSQARIACGEPRKTRRSPTPLTQGTPEMHKRQERPQAGGHADQSQLKYSKMSDKLNIRETRQQMPSWIEKDGSSQRVV